MPRKGKKLMIPPTMQAMVPFSDHFSAGRPEAGAYPVATPGGHALGAWSTRAALVRGLDCALCADLPQRAAVWRERFDSPTWRYRLLAWAHAAGRYAEARALYSTTTPGVSGMKSSGEKRPHP